MGSAMGAMWAGVLMGTGLVGLAWHYFRVDQAVGADAFALSDRKRRTRLERRLEIAELDPTDVLLRRLLVSAGGVVGGFVLVNAFGGERGNATLGGFLLAGILLVAMEVWLTRRVNDHVGQMRSAVIIFGELAASAAMVGSSGSTAVRDACQYGQGYAWATLRQAIRRTYASGSSLSAEFTTMAELYQLSELHQLAALFVCEGQVSGDGLVASAERQAEVRLADLLNEVERNRINVIVSSVLLALAVMLFTLFVVAESA